MVQILPLVGVAALFAQSAFAAAVPVRRTNDSGNQYNYNQYNSGSSHQNSGSQEHNVYQQQEQQSNTYDSNQYNQYNQNQNQYNQYEQNTYEAATTTTVEYQQEYNNNNYESTSTYEYAAMETSTSEEMMMESSTSEEMAMETTSTYEANTYEATQTYATEEQQAYETSSSSYAWPSYGSGSNNWNNGYNNCVQQCMAQFGAPPSTMTEEALPPPTGTGAVHTVLVAPEGAGLRYMPFAVNASMGDTIRYVWTTSNNHTATLSSALAVCNKSGIAEQRNFVSGVRNAAQGMQVFDVTVQTEEPQFFYCSVAQHCEKGMFGIINPGNSIGSPNTAGAMISSLMQSNPQMQAAWAYVQQNVTGTTAENWGMGIPLDGIPEDQYEEVAANILFTQANFAANPGMLESGQGAHNPDGSPIQIVSGLNVLLSSTGDSTPSTPLSLSSTVTPAATGSLTPVNAEGAAFSTRSISTWLAVVVGIASWMLI